MVLNFSIATQSHHDDIYNLMLVAFEPYVRKLGNGPSAGPYPWLEAAINNGDVYVGCDGDCVVGAISTVRCTGELIIDQLAVDPGRQGEGIGSQLIKSLEQIAIGEKMNALSLQTAEIMTDLLRLYDRHGFVETHRALPHHGDDEYLRVHMTKKL